MSLSMSPSYPKVGYRYLGYLPRRGMAPTHSTPTSITQFLPVRDVRARLEAEDRAGGINASVHTVAARWTSSQEGSEHTARMEAADQYKQRSRNIEGLLRRVSTLLDKHEREQEKEPANWGFAGDLGYVEERLTEVVEFLGGEGSSRTAASSYQGDPSWITARFPSKAEDGTPVKRGDKILYWPRTKTVMVGDKAEAAWRKFQSEVADEDAWNGLRYATSKAAAPFNGRDAIVTGILLQKPPKEGGQGLLRVPRKGAGGTGYDDIVLNVPRDTAPDFASIPHNTQVTIERHDTTKGVMVVRVVRAP